jgi:hypothetical protein
MAESSRWNLNWIGATADRGRNKSKGETFRPLSHEVASSRSRPARHFRFLTSSAGNVTSKPSSSATTSPRSSSVTSPSGSCVSATSAPIQSHPTGHVPAVVHVCTGAASSSPRRPWPAILPPNREHPQDCKSQDRHQPSSPGGAHRMRNIRCSPNI